MSISPSNTIGLDHGSGGRISHELIARLILPIFRNSVLETLHDGATLVVGNERIAFTTDTYVVDPIVFPGGSIGDLAVNGTVNDLAMCGAVPKWLSVGLILEEGFPTADLERILSDMARAAAAAGVTIVTGDTKVVPKGAADRIFINTAGIGSIPEHIHIAPDRARPGDRILLSGTIADHGVCVLANRQGMGFDVPIESDTAALNGLVQAMLETDPDIHVLRDPTRGGLGTTLNEIAVQAAVGIRIEEEAVPMRPAVAGLCELLGYDPLYLANEGKLVAVVSGASVERILETMRNHPLGRQAACIGEVVDAHPGRVVLKTRIGGQRIVDMLSGEQLPRIC
ncbi:MAG: hydrogenase expression/formation protein HypE [Thermodesulfobacteriota bacterium]